MFRKIVIAFFGLGYFAVALEGFRLYVDSATGAFLLFFAVPTAFILFLGRKRIVWNSFQFTYHGKDALKKLGLSLAAGLGALLASVFLFMLALIIVGWLSDPAVEEAHQLHDQIRPGMTVGELKAVLERALYDGVTCHAQAGEKYRHETDTGCLDFIGTPHEFDLVYVIVFFRAPLMVTVDFKLLLNGQGKVVEIQPVSTRVPFN